MPIEIDQFTNFSATYVYGGAGGAGTALNSSDTTLLIPVTATSLYPATAPFRLLIGQNLAGLGEIVLVTAVASNSFTITRGSGLAAPDTTIPQTWQVGTPVQIMWTAGNAQNLQASLQQLFSVMAYGATGNGSTDDTTAIQAASEAARLAGGGIVYFPPGTYIVHLTTNVNVGSVSAAIHMGSNVTLQGAGPGASIISLAAGAAVDQQRVVGNWNPQSSGTDAVLRIRDLCVNGNALHQTTGVSLSMCDGITFRYARDVLIENVISKNNVGTTGGTNGPSGLTGESHQFLAWDCADVNFFGLEAFCDDAGGIGSCIALSRCWNSQVTNCTSHDITYGGAFTSYECNGLVMNNVVGYNTVGANVGGFLWELDNYCQVSNCISGGITTPYAQSGPYAAATAFGAHTPFSVTGCSHMVFTNCITYGSTGSTSGFKVGKETSSPGPLESNDINFIGCEAINCTASGFQIQDATSDTSFIGCVAEGNAAVGIYNLSTDTAGVCIISGCRLNTNGSWGFRFDTVPPAGNVSTTECVGNTSGAFRLSPTSYTSLHGILTAPGIPGSTTPLTNPFPMAMAVNIIAGTVSVIAVNGTATGFTNTSTTSCSVRLPAGATITLTYTVSPTSWTWIAD